MNKKTRNAKKIKNQKLAAKRARKAAKRKKKLQGLRTSTPPRLDFGEIILALLEEDGATPSSVYEHIQENANDHEFQSFFDAIEDLVLELPVDDPQMSAVKELHTLFMEND